MTDPTAPSPRPSRRPAPWLVCLAAVVLCHLLFHVRPTYVHYGTMHFPREVPATEFSGADFTLLRNRVAGYFAPGGRPDSFHPSLVCFFSPFLAVSPRTGYQILLLLTTASHFALLFLVVRLTRFSADRTVLGAAGLIALFSYGMHFEWERGQTNLILNAVALAGVWVFHSFHTTRARWLSYVLVSFAFQLKIYPGIYFLCLFRDARAFRENILRAAGLTLFNAVLLSLGGTKTPVYVVQDIVQRVKSPLAWAGNHSISSFRDFLSDTAQFASLAVPLAVLAKVLLGVAAVLIGAGLLLRRKPPTHPAMLVFCLVCSLVIPAQSMDYKLSFFMGFGGALLAVCSRLVSGGVAWKYAALATASVAYAATSYSYVYKRMYGPLLANNLPALLVFMAATLAILLPDLYRRDAVPATPGAPPRGETTQPREGES